MGCGGSRLGGLAGEKGQEGGGIVPIPAGIRPLLRRRLEEMKKRSHASVLKGSQTQSKKELLRTGSSEDGDTEENDGSLKSLAKIAPATPEHHVEEKKEVIYENAKERDDVKEVKEEVVVKKEEEGDKEVVKNQAEGDKEEVKTQEEENHHQDDVDVKKEGDDGKNHDDVEGMMNSFDERMIGPGSPSFRVYCVDVPSDGDEEKDGEDTKKTIETETVTTELKEEQSSVKNEKNRERKGRRFGIALPKKYLANVTAPCMGNNAHNTRIVQEKSSQ